MNQDVINCPACSRRTPSARAACMYCGAALPVTSIEAAPPQRAIDIAESAFNTIIEPARSAPDARAEAALAAALKIETDEARAIISSGKALPVARTQTRQEAELIAALVRTCGLASRVIADEELKPDTELIRARRIAPVEAGLEITHSGGRLSIAPAEIRLLVVGLLKNNRIDFTEGKAGMRGGSSNVLDTAEFRSEEMLLDVYSESLERSFRVRSDAFDYSGLVAPLAFRTELNFESLIARFEQTVPGVKVDRDFGRVSRLLSRAWPERSKTESRGVKRTGISLRPVAQSSVVSNNRDQFNRYSRLMFVSFTPLSASLREKT